MAMVFIRITLNQFKRNQWIFLCIRYAVIYIMYIGCFSLNRSEVVRFIFCLVTNKILEIMLLGLLLLA